MGHTGVLPYERPSRMLAREHVSFFAAVIERDKGRGREIKTDSG